MIDNSGMPMFSVDTSMFDSVLSAARTKHDFENHRAQFLLQATNFLDKHQKNIYNQHRDGASGTQTVTHLTQMTDALITVIFDCVMVDLDKGCPCSLIALGGYGRAEMTPRSDIDLMLFVQDSTNPLILKISERILYLLWDLGLDVGHSVRTESQCQTIAANDLTACTSLLDSRLICGDEVLFQHYWNKVLPTIVKNNSNTFMREKIIEHKMRLKKYGSSVYLLEPNIKEGEGGLRDLHTTLWLCKVKYKVNQLRGLVIKGVITELEKSEFNQALDYLWRIRCELHYLSKRKNEQLHFEQQEQIAQFLGYKDSKGALAVEQFMQDYYEHATRTEHFTATLIARATERENIQHGLIGYARRRNIDDDFYALKGELFPLTDDIFAQRPEAMMQAFWLMQRHQLKLSLPLKTLIRDHLPQVNNSFRRSKQINKIFLDILRYKKLVYETLFQMHHLLFLNYYIPEFKRIFCQVQHDAYHIYTVDTHTLFAVQEITRLWDGEYQDSKPLLTKIADEIEKPELMILAVLLHDIGKGEGHKHCEKGAAMVPTIARRLGLGKESSRRLEFLVRHHLQMAHIAQRRDLNDIHLIAQFAQTMDNSENLKMLYLLTFSDIKAVGPDVWTAWKGFLLQELYEKTYSVIERGNFHTEKYSEKIRTRKRKVKAILSDDYDSKIVSECLRNFSTRFLMAYHSSEIAQYMRVILDRGRRTLSMQVEHNMEQCFTNVVISTVDIPGLFSLIAGVMAVNGVNILGAQIFTQKNGIAIDILQVDSNGQIYADSAKWQKIEQKLNWYLVGRGIINEVVQRKENSLLELSNAAPDVTIRVDVDNDVSHEYTVIDISAKDKVGLLYKLTDCFKNMGIYIYVSKITTKGDIAGDTFYVQDIFGRKIVDTDKLAEIKRILMAALSE